MKFASICIKNTYSKLLELSKHKHSSFYLALVSFCESIFFPIPQDVMMIPMMLANRKKIFFYALIATLASVLGGIAGYYIGYGFYELVGKSIVEFYGYGDKLNYFKDLYLEWGFWIVIIGGVTPIPYKIVSIGSGLLVLNPLVFIFASILGRAFRLFLAGVLVYYFGNRILSFIDKNIVILTIVVTVIIVSGFIAIAFI